jgi:hypothetical protein
MCPLACGGVAGDGLGPDVVFTRQSSMLRLRIDASLRAGVIGAARDKLSFIRCVMDWIMELTNVKFISWNGLFVDHKDYGLPICQSWFCDMVRER